MPRLQNSFAQNGSEHTQTSNRKGNWKITCRHILFPQANDGFLVLFVFLMQQEQNISKCVIFTHF